MKRTILFLILAIFVAAVLRLFKLGEVPTGPNWDEAALGYNAYSVLKTGRDEYGTFFPLSLRSYDDYKPPLYMYITVPSVAAFGLNLWAVRLPSVVMGLLAVFGTFFFTRELILFSPQLKKKEWLPPLASLLLALSPWHIQFSRIAFEANTGVTLNIWAATFFLWGLKRSKFFSASAFLFALSLYAYHSQRVFAPLLVLLLAITFYRELLKKWKELVIPIVVGMFTLAPLVPVLLSPTTLTRLSGTSSLSDLTHLLENNVQKLEFDRKNNDYLGLVLDNRRIVYAKTVLNGYLSHYNLNWLFINGDNARHHAPGMGLLYFVELPFLLLGIYLLATKGRKMGVILLGWMILAPIAASPTTELPHAIRTLVFLPSLQITTALGFLFFLEKIRVLKRPVSLFILGIVSMLVVFNGSYYFLMYFVEQNHEYSKFWQYGYAQAVSYASEHRNEYKKIVVSTALEQPHMFFLFYLRYDPVLYLKEGGTASGGFEEVKNRFDVFEFRPINWALESHDGSVLYIGKPGEVPVGSLSSINYLDGTPAIYISH